MKTPDFRPLIFIWKDRLAELDDPATDGVEVAYQMGLDLLRLGESEWWTQDDETPLPEPMIAAVADLIFGLEVPRSWLPDERSQRLLEEVQASPTQMSPDQVVQWTKERRAENWQQVRVLVANLAAKYGG